jgi:hypothetical protein
MFGTEHKATRLGHLQQNIENQNVAVLPCHAVFQMFRRLG